MYAIIRAGGKQAKVSAGDLIEVERVKDASDTIEFQPILLVDDDGTAHSGADALAGAVVTARVIGETKGDKIDIFKYKNKTGYRRRMGHRQTYTQLEITGVELPSAKKPAPADEPAAKKTAAADEPAAKKPAAKKPAAKKPAAKKPAATKPATKKTPAVEDPASEAGENATVAASEEE
ncbi:hypothetical protein BH23ACT5_BH23ACT5_06100 [soil metagenome]